LRQFFTFTFVAIKVMFRSRETIFWNLLFPIALFLLYVTVFAGIYPSSVTPERAVADNFAKILVITIMSGGLFSLAISVSVLKEKGILRRYKVTPVRPVTIVSGIVVRQYFFLILITVINYLIALIGYHADFGGNIFDLLLITSLGILVFCALGFTIAGITFTNQGTVGFANLLFMPMLFLSGAAIPAFLFPKWLIHFATVFPATHLLNLMQNVLFMGHPLIDNMGNILILVAFGLGFMIISSLTFRWE
jgi:ABC-2 type transport system permease protein